MDFLTSDARDLCLLIRAEFLQGYICVWLHAVSFLLVAVPADCSLCVAMALTRFRVFAVEICDAM
jgi:hypothetical protein